MYMQRPTSGIKEAGRNARAFMKSHMNEFFSTYLPFALILFACYTLDAIMNDWYVKPARQPFVLGTILSSFVILLFSLNWFRFVMVGPEKFVAINPFKPRWRDLKTVLILSGVIFIIVILLFIGFAVVARTAKIAVPFYAIAAFVILFVSSIKLNFYLAARAARHLVTMGQAWSLSNGYVLKMFAGNVVANWRLILALFAYAVVMIFILVFMQKLGLRAEAYGIAKFFLINLVQSLLVMPLVLGASIYVIANFYQHAIDGLSLPESSGTQERDKQREEIQNEEPF